MSKVGQFMHRSSFLLKHYCSLHFVGHNGKHPGLWRWEMPKSRILKFKKGNQNKIFIRFFTRLQIFLKKSDIAFSDDFSKKHGLNSLFRLYEKNFVNLARGKFKYPIFCASGFVTQLINNW